MTITDGADQHHRLPEALREGYFNVDEQSFETLLAISAEFAAALQYFDLNNRKDGTWQALFTADETVIMAMMLSTDLKRLEMEYLRRARDAPTSVQHFLYQLAARIDVWFKKLSLVEQPPALTLSQDMAGIIQERLAAPVHTFGDTMTRMGADMDFRGFDRVWGFRIEPAGVSFPRAAPPAGTGVLERQRVLRATFDALLNGFAYFKSITPACLRDSLHSKAHDPAMGLFMAFLQLFRQVQDQANRFTRRHLDFYYRRVLQASPIEPQPAGVHLVIQTAPGCVELRVPAGTAFSAGKDSALNDVIYRADNGLLVNDAEVQALHTLHLQRDRTISPENELGYVTRMKVDRVTVASLGATEDPLPVWPLMGAERLGSGRQTARDADVGLAIASPLLLLKEGRRIIDVHIVAQHSDVEQEVARLRAARSQKAFFRQLGSVFSRFLLGGPGWLKARHRAEILELTRARVGDAYDYVEHILPPGEALERLRQHHFHTLLKAMFTVRLTADSGWYTVADPVIQPGAAQGDGEQRGFSLAITLGPDVEPIVPYQSDRHGGAWKTSQPLMLLTLNAKADFFPYSLFNALVLTRIAIQTRVEGLKNLLAYNHHGQLDPSKPFNPFGPLPGHQAYLVFGNDEIATKNLTALRLHLEWGELPNCVGGFKTHYQAYEQAYGNDSFTVAPTIIRDGRWLPGGDGKQAQTRLFDTADAWGKVSAHRTIEVDVSRHFKPVPPAVAADRFRFDLNARNGFFKLTLTGPEGAFGHRDYPLLLTRALSDNARLRRPRPVPAQPYTPLINRMSVDYTAKTVLHLDVDRQADLERLDEQLFHLHPFGMECVYPAAMARQPYVLPRYGDDGNLFIGIRARQLPSRLTLFFHLADDARQTAAATPAQIKWFYLTEQGWRSLPAASVLSDTTNGFLTTGIVSLAMPADIGFSGIMPAGLYWLRVSANGDLRAMSGGYAVRTHALRVTRLDPAQADPVKVDWQPVVSIPGMGRVWQIGPALGGRGRETPEQLNTRINERLRHKYRAATPWDYERLILERFPDIFKVKCFPHQVAGRATPQPGHVLIVVVPRVSAPEADGCLARLTSPVELARIKTFVNGLSSPFVRVDVRNPVYERIQVRCTVKFVKAIQSGYFINRVNKAITDYICPWRDGGYQACFGWTIRQQDIESHIRSLEYVEYVTNFSMLHITQDDRGKYRLADTATVGDDRFMDIRPRYPWSLALPARDHFIETTHTFQSIPALVTGVSELEVGYTFIINEKNRHETE